MLSDRNYMRDAYPGRRTSVHVWLIAALGAAFVLELVLLSPWWRLGQPVVGALLLTPGSLKAWHLWTLLTHPLVHDNQNPFHILFVLILLAFLGRDLTPVLGGRRFLAVFAGATVTGALAWAATHWVHGGTYFGATAGVAGLFVTYAGLFPEQEVTLFPFPVSLRPRQLVWGMVALDVFGLILYEILGAAAPFDFSASAHLGGLFFGWVYYRYLHAARGWDRAPGAGWSWRLPAWLRRRPAARAGTETRLPLPGRSDLRREVDRILDKINSEGFGALTADEKRILDEAKDLLSRR